MKVAKFCVMANIIILIKITNTNKKTMNTSKSFETAGEVVGLQVL